MPEFRLQPIVDLHSDDTLGFELLAGRQRCPDWRSTDWLDWYAGMSTMLLAHTPQDMRIFVNLDAEQACDTDLTQMLDRVIRERRCTLEWTEHWARPESHVTAAAVFRDYASRGVPIAVDDIGDGFDGIGRTLLVLPRFAKLGINLVHRGRTAGAAYLSNLRGVFSGLGCDVIAEGIETTNDLALCRAAGIRYGQGFLFGDGALPD